MFFTEEDYKKIEKYLASCGVKDSCLEDAKLPIEGNEKIAIVQNGENRILYIRELLEALSNSKASLSDLYNVTDHAKEKYINLKQAIELVPYKARKIGQIITFLNPASKWELYQFQGTSILQWNELSLWNDFFNLDSYVIKSILPDEEDLTKSENDGKGNSYLSLKDREYNPDEFSGLGKVILRKNIMEVETEGYGKVKKNVLLQDMINKPNTIYEIRYDFDLNNQEITIPEGCVLDFYGGSLSNGGIHGKQTFINSLNSNILYKIFLTGTYRNQFNFDWLYYENIDLKDVIKTTDLIFLFSNTTYNLNISPWTLPEGTVFKGVTGEFDVSTLNLNVSNTNNNFYLWKISPKCTIKNLSFRLKQVIESIFLLLDTSISNSSDYRAVINNISITGHWVDSDKEQLKGTGIAIYIRDYNDDGSYAKLSSQSFSLQSYHNITIKNLKTGILIQAHKKYKDNKQYGCWATAIYFYNLEIWADLGVKIMSQYLLHKEDSNIDESLSSFIDDLRFDGFVYQRMGIASEYNKAMYGGPSFITINNMALWDTEQFGNLIGTIVVGASRRIPFGRGNLVNWGIKPIEGEEEKLNIRGTSDYQRDKIILAVNEISDKESIPKAYEITAGLYGGISMTCNTQDLEHTTTNASIQLVQPEWGEGVKNSISRKDPNVTIPYYDIIYPMMDQELYLSTNTKLPYFKIRTIQDNTEQVKSLNLFPIVTDDLNTDQRVQNPNLLYSLIIDGISENTYIKNNTEFLNLETTHIIGRTYGNNHHLNDVTSYKGYGRGLKFFNLDTKQTFFGEKLSTEDFIHWYDVFGNPFNAKDKGNSSQRPSNVKFKFQYYDTFIKQFIWWNGEKWVTYDGINADIKRLGTFAQKPTTTDNIPVGFAYFCTDKQTTEGTTNGIMIYHKGNNVWVDALGRVVS